MGSLIGFLIRRFKMHPSNARAAAYAVVGLGILILAWAFLSLSQCSSNRQKAAQGRIDSAQSGAASASAADAVNTTTGVGNRAQASEDLTRSNREDIRNAEGANEAVNPGVRDAGLASLCKRRAYRDDQRCKLRNSSPQ